MNCILIKKKYIFCLCVRRKYCLSVLVLKEWCINCREREKKLAELRSLKSDFKPGVWNVNAVLLGGLGKEPEVDGKDLPVCSLLLPAIKRCLKISFWFGAVHWNQMQSEWKTLRRFYHLWCNRSLGSTSLHPSIILSCFLHEDENSDKSFFF